MGKCLKKLEPSKRQTLFRTKKNNRRAFGFNLSLCNDNKDYVMATIWGLDIPRGGKEKPYIKVFDNKDALINEFKTNDIFKKSVIFATDLKQDFLATFFGTEDENKFFIMMAQSSNILYAKTYFDNNNFSFLNKRPGSKERLSSLEFYDTQNYGGLSITEMGEHLNISPLEEPIEVTMDGSVSIIDLYPRTQEEWDYLSKYNMQDSEISYKFMNFFIEQLESIGGSFKVTTSSSSMTLFRHRFLKDTYYQQSIEHIREQIQSYYGGRCEAFCRGSFEDLNYMDYNSSYPWEMFDKEFPDPNTMRTSDENTTQYLENYTGCTTCEVEHPYMHKPILPYKYEEGPFTKLIFPYGKFKGTWPNNELQYAISQGVKITKVYRSIYYKKTCRPFREFIGVLYPLRMEAKEKGDPVQVIYKFLMNSLSGKFGQKFDEIENLVHKDNMTKKMGEQGRCDPIGNWFSVIENVEPSRHCIPIWSAYITAYGRIRLHKDLMRHDAFYCDTDSFGTKDNDVVTGNKLGEIKVEMKATKGFIVRPKLYGLLGDKEHIRVKGLSVKMTFDKLCGIKPDDKFYYNDFASLKKAAMYNYAPAQISRVYKQFDLDDDKRIWPKLFDGEFQRSEPICIGKEEDYVEKLIQQDINTYDEIYEMMS